MGKSFGNQQTQIFVTLSVLTQQHQVIRIVINTMDTVFHIPAGHIHLAADNGLDACSLGSLIKVDTTVHYAMVSDGNGILTQFLHPVHHTGNAASAIKKAVFGMYMQMNKTHVTDSFDSSTSFFSR